MCIYCGTNKYRKIYKNHHGPIPKDTTGRTYEIHHIDGDHSNNDPANLIAVTLQEHYNIHYAQGDYNACMIMSERMNLSKEEISELATKNNFIRVNDGTHPFLGGKIQKEAALKRVENGTHPWQKRPDGMSLSSERVENGTHHLLTRPDGTSKSSDRVKAGTHNFQGKDGSILSKQTQANLVKNGIHNFQKRPDGTSKSSDRVKVGTHNWLDNECQRKKVLKQLRDGIHSSQHEWSCEYCKTSGKGKGNYTRYHGNNCKLKYK